MPHPLMKSVKLLKRTWTAIFNTAKKKDGNPINLYSEIMVPVSPVLYAKVSRKAEDDGVPVRTVMETALQKFVAQHA